MAGLAKGKGESGHVLQEGQCQIKDANKYPRIFKDENTDLQKGRLVTFQVHPLVAEPTPEFLYPDTRQYFKPKERETRKTLLRTSGSQASNAW